MVEHSKNLRLRLQGRVGLGRAALLAVQVLLLVSAWKGLSAFLNDRSASLPVPASLSVQLQTASSDSNAAEQRVSEQLGGLSTQLTDGLASSAAMSSDAAMPAGGSSATQQQEQEQQQQQQQQDGNPSQADGAAQGQQPVATSNLTEWAAAPDKFAFLEPQSRCLLHPGGRAELPAGWDNPGSLPFLFDTASMPTRATACQHCPKQEKPLLCCGVCIFEERRCDTFYPKDRRSEKTAQLLLAAGFQLQAFSPCELFQRIRGRTLWFMGDSQTWHYFYSAECFLRNFARHWHRTPPVPVEENKKLITVTWPVVVPPLCLELALGTRVCAVRVDEADKLMGVVLPRLQALLPNFKDDIMIYNTGLHYETPGNKGKPVNASKMVTDLAGFASWRQRYRSTLPKLIWMDVPVQHFTGWDGSYNGGEKPFRCAPLAAWAAKDPTTLAGGRRNAAVAPLIPRFADAHLKTWNASAPLWDTHKPDECTHWCSPSAYHLWLLLLNDLLRDSGLGSSVQVQRPESAASGVGAGTVAPAPGVGTALR